MKGQIANGEFFPRGAEVWGWEVWGWVMIDNVWKWVKVGQLKDDGQIEWDKLIISHRHKEAPNVI